MQQSISSIHGHSNKASWRDFVALCKPKVVLLMLLTVVVGAFIATPGWPDFLTLSLALLGIGATAASGAAINHLIDHQLDAKMARTRHRPIVQGLISPAQALLFALLLALAGLGSLWFLVNPLTAWLTLFSLLGYAVIYTLFLKRATPQNITIGGLAGAMPPLLGWTAMTGEIHPHALLLVLIIFAWTPPHFWALALHKKADYANADIPMLPITHGDAFTRVHIVLYSLLLFITTLLPFATGMSGYVYLAGVLLLNVRQLLLVQRLFDLDNHQAPFQLFKYSIIYLFWLFLIILVDHALLSTG